MRMTGNWRKLLAIGGGAASAAALMVGATLVYAGPNGTGGGPTAEKILGSGSDTDQIAMMHLDGLYMVSEGCAKFTSTSKPLDFSCIAPDPAGTITTENYEHDQLSEADFLGSSIGIKQLCTQGVAGTAYIDFARSSRAPKAGDCTGLHFVAYARDGISLEAHSDGTVNSGIFNMANTDPLCTGLGYCLTQTQVKGIYANCTITNWSQVGGQNLTIQIYTPQSGSGTRAQFETFLGIADSSVCITADGQPSSHFNVPENQNTGIASTDTNTFIFPFSYAIFHTEVGTGGGYSLAAIDGVAPSSSTIGCITGVGCTIFPYSRYIYNVVCTAVTAPPAAPACGNAPGHLVTTKTADYVGEEGWICKPGANENAAWVGNQNVPALDTRSQSPHSTSPHYGANWATLISKKITARGFAPLAIDIIGGGNTNSDHCRLTTT